MRLISFCLIAVAVVAAVAVVRPAQAGRISSHTHAAATPQSGPQPVNDHDESRVVVQLVVAGAAAAVVVGAGTAAYFLRRRLGLTAYSPDEAGDGGHH